MTKHELPFVSVVACLAVVCVDLLTNRLPIEQYDWDFKFYIEMAENGAPLRGPLVAPFAYRYGTTLPVSALKAVAGIPVQSGFKVLAYVGTWMTLVFVYFLARRVGSSRGQALVCLFVTAFSFCNVKFLMFDVFRPDVLGQPLILLSTLLILRRETCWATGVSAVGLQCREFLVIPPLLIMLQGFHTLKRARGIVWRLGMMRVALVLAVVIAAVVVPRLLLRVEHSWGGYVDPIADSGFIGKSWSDLTNGRRSVNVVLSLVSYSLPALLLATPARVSRLRFDSEERARWLGYTALVVLLTFVGGSDVDRFAAYLLVPQIVVLSRLLALRPPLYEVAYMLLAVALVNRIFLPVPVEDLESYLATGYYSDLLDVHTVKRVAWMLAAVVGAHVLRVVTEESQETRLVPEAIKGDAAV